MNQFGPWLPAVFPVGVLQAAHGTGDAGSAIAEQAVLCRLARGRVDIHIARGSQGSAFAVIEERGSAVGKPDQHEPAAADIAGAGVCDRERESDRDGRIDGIASCLQNLQAGGGGVFFPAHDHAVFCPDRLSSPGGSGEKENGKGATHKPDSTTEASVFPLREAVTVYFAKVTRKPVEISRSLRCRPCTGLLR